MFNACPGVFVISGGLSQTFGTGMPTILTGQEIIAPIVPRSSLARQISAAYRGLHLACFQVTVPPGDNLTGKRRILQDKTTFISFRQSTHP